MTTNQERLNSFLIKDGDCLLFQGGKAHAYGVFWMNGKNHRAHRAAFELHHGRVPNGVVMHSCDNPLCCNVDHLSEGTQRDNMVDMVNKQRSLKGTNNPACKLSDSDVEFIRASTLKVKELAKMFGVTRQTISSWRK